MGNLPTRLRTFLRELKRRNVYRVGATYVVVAFVGFQAANLLIPSTVLPAWADEFFLFLLIVGFPMALVIAWAFELTPEGMRRTPHPERLDRGPHRPRRSEEPAGWLAGEAGEPGTAEPGTEHPPTFPEATPRTNRAPDVVGDGPRPDRMSVAVLPFANVSPDPGDEYLSDGITEELIAALGGVRNLQVAARTSVFAYKGRNEDVRSIGRALGVGSVVEGSVRRSGDHLRITAELVETAEGYQVWTRTFDRRLEDVFAIQEEIARGIVEHLKVRLLRPHEGLVEHGTDDVEAYDLYLEGRYHLNRRTPRSLDQAVAAFGRSVESDPGFARAHAGLAEAHLLLERYGVAAPGESMPAAERSARRAVELDESLAEAHVPLAYVEMLGNWNFDAASREFERAIQLNPEYAPAHHWYGWCLAGQGRLAEALSELQRARALEPLSLIIRTNIGTMLYFGRCYDEAEDQLEDVLALDPNFAVAHQWLGRVHQAAGRLPEAVEAFRTALEVLRDDPETIASLGYALGRAGRRTEASELRGRLDDLASARKYVSPYWYGLILLGLGDREGGLDELERAFDVRFDWLLFLHVDPMFDPYRDDDRFDGIVRRTRQATTSLET